MARYREHGLQGVASGKRGRPRNRIPDNLAIQKSEAMNVSAGRSLSGCAARTRPLASVEDLATINPLRILIVDDNEDGAESRLPDWKTRAFFSHKFLFRISGGRIWTDMSWRGACIWMLKTIVPRLSRSSATDRRDRVLVKEAGFDHHFVKRIDIGALQKALALVESR